MDKEGNMCFLVQEIIVRVIKKNKRIIGLIIM